jgi:hypothetical protein
VNVHCCNCGAQVVIHREPPAGPPAAPLTITFQEWKVGQEIRLEADLYVCGPACAEVVRKRLDAGTQ